MKLKTILESKDISKVRFYHGSIDTHLTNIKKHGLLPRSVSGMGAAWGATDVGGSRAEWIYLTKNLTIAQNAAFQVAFEAPGTRPIVVEVVGLNIKLFRPDEDCGATWEESFKKWGNVAYEGSIPPSKILSIMISEKMPNCTAEEYCDQDYLKELVRSVHWIKA